MVTVEERMTEREKERRERERNMYKGQSINNE